MISNSVFNLSYIYFVNKNIVMATHAELALEWLVLYQISTENWSRTDLQLAAELGKTLLERNKELEATIKEQRSIIEDKTQETEYLSKQTAALREVNDSRLRIYEQLEISIQELEKNNQRLTAETNADKRKIKNLSGTVDHLETKCEDLERSLEEAKAFQLQQQHHLQEQNRGRPLTRRSFVADENSLRRSMSCENSAQSYEDLIYDFSDMKVKVANLEAKLKAANEQRLTETKKREDVEIEYTCLSQENGVLREQLTVLKDKTNLRSFEDELTSLDDTTSSRVCRKCMCGGDETESNMTVQDIADDFEDLDASYDSIQGECALVKLKNGGYAWGSQESLASMGQVVNCVGSSGSSPQAEGSEVPHNSLLSELDTEYRILIEKYEALVEARDTRENFASQETTTMVDSGIDEVSGPMSIVMADIGAESVRVGGALQCSTCASDIKPNPVPGPTRKTGYHEELSEVETSSSGFSEGEVCTRATQTEPCDDLTPVASEAGVRFLDLRTPMNPCETRFQNKPEYRKLFHEIFEVLKNDVDKKQVKLVVTRTPVPPEDNDDETEEGKGDTTLDISDLSIWDENEENESPNVMKVENSCGKVERECGGDVTESSVEKKGSDVKEENMKEVSKPPRPDSLDLDSASTCSSKSRRRRRPHRNRQNEQQTTLQQQQQINLQKQQRENEIAQRVNGPVEAASQRAPSSTRVAIEPAAEPLSTPRPSSAPATSISRPSASKEPKPESNDTKPNSSRDRCKHKARKHSKQKHTQQPLLNKHLSKALGQHIFTQSPPKDQVHHNTPPPPPPPKSIPASVHVANLIKFEMSYAQVLKSNKPRRDAKLP